MDNLYTGVSAHVDQTASHGFLTMSHMYVEAYRHTHPPGRQFRENSLHLRSSHACLASAHHRFGEKKKKRPRLRFVQLLEINAVSRFPFYQLSYSPARASRTPCSKQKKIRETAESIDSISLGKNKHGRRRTTLERKDDRFGTRREFPGEVP